MNTTVCFSIVTTFFPDDKQMLIGILEGGIGLGILLGPLLGAVLYELGGYCCPFWSILFVFLCCFPLLNKMMAILDNEKRNNFSSGAQTRLNAHHSTPTLTTVQPRILSPLNNNINNLIDDEDY